MIQEFFIPLHRFDLNLLPANSRKIGSEAFMQAVVMHFATEYASSGQGAIVAVDSDGIRVMTYPLDTDPLDMVMPMLQSGRLQEALPYLESLTKQLPDHAQVLYNLGICYSELGQYDEAVIRLKRAVQIDPRHAHAWVGIGTAYHRMRKPEQALEAFARAMELSPADPFVRRGMGGVLLATGRAAEALPHLRQALKALPDDPQTLFALAAALESIDTPDSLFEADALYQRLITEHSQSQAGEMAEKARTRLAHKQLQQGVVGGVRLDVVAYIKEALQLFEKVGKNRMQQIALEIAMLGSSGLSINDPERKYNLQNLPGQFSGLQLLSYMYAAFQQIDPSVDMGADFAKEYAMAKGEVI